MLKKRKTKYMKNNREIYAKMHLKETQDIFDIISNAKKSITCKEIASRMVYSMTTQQINCLITYNLRSSLNREVINGQAHFSIKEN